LNPVHIEAPSGPADWSRIREICCETAYAGAGLDDPLRAEFFGRYWVGPYERLLPEWTRVARSDGRILGYLTGCPDTARFERRRFFLNDAPLLAQVLAGAYPKTQDTRAFVRRFFRVDKSADRYFSDGARRAWRSQFPAHLHINLTAESRGRGLGRLLLEDYFERLRADGVPGVHVHCGAAPVEFYRKTGFEVLEERRTDAGSPIFVLTQSLARVA
jgi:GNAT superfamily N-acetyltransferase